MPIRLKNETIKKPRTFVSTGKIASKRVLHVAEDISWNYGEDVVVYDVGKRTPYVSYYIVASAKNDQRLKSLVQVVKDSLYDNYMDLANIEGRNSSTWILLDAKQVVVQLFTSEQRTIVDFDEIYDDCPHQVVISETEPKYRKRKRIRFDQ